MPISDDRFPAMSPISPMLAESNGFRSSGAGRRAPLNHTVNGNHNEDDRNQVKEIVPAKGKEIGYGTIVIEQGARRRRRR